MTQETVLATIFQKLERMLLKQNNVEIEKMVKICLDQGNSLAHRCLNGA